MIQQGTHVRIEELFAPDGNGALSYFYASNKIISNPHAFVEILREFPDLPTIEQQKQLKQIILILEQVSTNSYILNCVKESNITELLIELIPSYVENFVIFNKLLTILDYVLKMGSTDQQLIEKSIKKLIIQFHAEDGWVQQKSIFAVVNILKSYLNCKINMDKQPDKMITFHGGNGLEIRPNGKKQINWIFSNGMSIYFWLNIQNIKFGTEASLPKLFTFYSPNNGGLQCYLIDNKIYYRTVGSKYNSPKIGSNGICLGEIEPKKWNFIGIEHEGPKRILGRSHIIFHLNDKKVSFNLSPPSISSKQKMKIVFFDKIYCKTSSICIIPAFTESQFAQTLNKNKNSIDLIKNSKALVFQERQGALYERNQFGYCPDPIIHRSKQMNFQVIIPLFHIYKFAKAPNSYPILNEILSLFVLYLYKSPHNQTQAQHKNYPHIICELIKSLPKIEQKFNQETVNTLLHIKQTITNPQLLRQYHGQLIWSFIDSNISISSKQMLLEIIKNNFTQNVSYFSNIIGLDQMLNSIMKLGTKTSKCCEKHYKIMINRFEKDLMQSETNEKFGQNQLALEYILKIIELEVQNQKVNTAQEIYKLCRVLSLKFSPCFTLSFMTLIRRVLTEKINEKLNTNQAKKIIEYLMSKKIYLMFLHVIENSFFAQIKAESIKIIYSLLLKRASPIQHEEISFRISKALWKINEDGQHQPKMQSFHNSPQKQKEELQQQPPQINLMKASSNGKNLRMSSLGSQQQDSLRMSEKSSSKNKASSIFKQVGPQAPQLTNKSKGSKTFSFNFMNEGEKSKKKQTFSAQQMDYVSEQAPQALKKQSSITRSVDVQEQIMEEQKTNQNEILHLHSSEEDEEDAYVPNIKSQQDLTIKKQQPKQKKRLRNFNLNIDTDQINKMYTFGGEKGQQIMISEEQQQAELEKIRKLAKICVSAMTGQKYQAQKQKDEQKQRHIKFAAPPSTTSNKVLKARESVKQGQLKLIDEESEPESAVKKPSNLINNIITSIPSPNLGSKKSKSPTNISSISEQNLVILYNSLMESCVSLPNYDFTSSSVLYIFFSWIPQTNLEVKFLFDLSLIIENDDQKQKMRVLVKMPQFYDFLFELVYKALLFQQMGEKRLYTEKLQEIIRKVFAFIFREEPESLDKFAFIIQWAISKSKQYHPKCLFLASRYIFFMIMDAIQEDLFTNSKNDKLMERNFQYLGITVCKFCKFLPTKNQLQNELEVTTDEFDRIIFEDSFGMLPSIAPYFTSPWVDYLICEKYFILFKKFFCTDWYSKNLKIFQSYMHTNNLALLQNILTNSLTTQALILNAQSQYYLKNSFIFTLIEVNRLLFIEKQLREDSQSSQRGQILWQTILIILFAESTKQKNHKNNSEFIMSILKNCKIFCDLQFKNSSVIIHVLKFIKEMVAQGSTTNMTGSGLHDGSKDLKASQGPKFAQFVQFFVESYINENLFQGQNSFEFQNFKLNFREVWIPGENHESKIKSELHSKLIDKIVSMEDNTPNYIEQLSNIIEQQTQRASNVEILIQTADREARSCFRKLWKNLRIYGSAWTHPELSFQNNTLFNKTLFTYERYEPSKFYKYRICKHMSKYRLRYLLKPLLNSEPNIKKQDDEISFQKQEIGLHRALLYYNEGKLILGTRVISWIFSKHDLPNLTQSSSIKPLDFLMQFKKVRLIKTLTVRHGYLGIVNDKLVFINSFYKQPPTHLSIAEYKVKDDKNLFKIWPLQYIKQLFRRRYVNRKRALQINFIYGKSAMFEFNDKDIEDFIKLISKLQKTKCPNLVNNKSLTPIKKYQNQGLLKKWSTYQISNFEYLMEINNLAGRSYCDLTQYPVMPWIIINFDNKIALSQENNFRNLALPMGALGSQQRTQGFMERYENMAEIQTQRFHYGTHYSSPAIIYHFLVRLSPFTEGSILLQSGKFDFADRLFFSIADSYKNATSQYSDVRQLIPEMYTFPEAYLNLNKLDLGVMQNQKRVHNVELPGWARDNPYVYVCKIRKAFQDIVVSRNISKWIDLIFGYKQKGAQAVKNLNCFVHITYQDSIDFKQIKDEKTVKALETQILNFGQTPTQIFAKTPHQQRVSPLLLPIQGTICDPNVEPKIYRPSKQPANTDLLKEEKQQFNAMRQPPESIIQMRWFKDSRLVFIRRNGQMLVYKWHTPISGSSKVPFQCAIQKQKAITRITKNVPENMEFFDNSLKTDSFPLELINNGHHIALGGQVDGKLLFIDTDTNVVQCYIQHSDTICCVKSDLKDNFLITGDITGKVVVWRITSNHKLTFYYSVKDHRKQITSIFISYDLRCLFTSSMDGSAFGYNIITGRKMKVFYHPQKLPISNVVVSTSPLPIVILFCNSSGSEPIIYCFSINGQLIQRVREKQFEHFLSPILIRDTLGFEHVAYGNEHGQTFFRTLPFLDNPIKHIVARDAAVNRVCLSKSSKYVIIGCSDGELSVITAPDQQQVAK